MLSALIGLVCVLALVFVRVPIAFAMGFVGVLGVAHERGSLLDASSYLPAISLAARQISDTPQDYALSVIPLFIVMGLFISKGGLSRELYNLGNTFLGHMRGGLAMATVVACGGFSAICGSSLATVATMSRVAIPEMRRFGYDDSLSSAAVASAGTLGALIPPSVVLVIYGILTETSIGKLFIAGIVPGVVGILFYLAAVRWVVFRRPEAGPCGERYGWRARARALGSVWAVLLLFVFIIGGLYGMFDVPPLNLAFSPTEVAGMGAMGAFLIALARRRLAWRDLFEVLRDAVLTSAGLFMVLIGAALFSAFVNLAGLPEALAGFVTGYDVPPLLVIALISVIYLLLGCVFESLSLLLLTVPIFFPVVMALGFDPVWFGIFVVVVTEIGMLTPPIGMNVFVLQASMNDIPAATIFRGITPFWVADLFRLALIVFVPAVALVLL